MDHCILWARVSGFRMDQWATIRGWPQVRGHGERSTRHVYNWTLHHNNKKTLRHSVPTLPNCANCYAVNVHFLQCVHIFAKVDYELCRVRLSVRPSVHVSARISAASTGRISVKYLSKNSKLCYKRTKFGHCTWRSKYLLIFPAT